jgi:transposase
MIDNLPAHTAGVRKESEAHGATPRYSARHSPDLNPIEMLFKGLSRCTLTVHEACNCFRHASYA